MSILTTKHLGKIYEGTERHMIFIRRLWKFNKLFCYYYSLDL